MMIENLGIGIKKWLILLWRAALVMYIPSHGGWGFPNNSNLLVWVMMGYE
jgi:hypothetical protein